MQFFDKFKQFLGISDRQESPQINEPDRPWPEPPQRHADEFEPPFRNFSVFSSDPFEIHKYFEQQMSEMLRNFGFQEFGDGFSHTFDEPQLEIEEIPSEETPSSGNLREHFLKPGFEKPKTGVQDKRDQDIDGRLDIKDWGSVFKGESSQPQMVPKTRFFGQSVTSKTVRNADGSFETHHTVRDNEGNEETRITRKIGDKEYSIIKRRDKEGKEEMIENLVNLDESEKNRFFPEQQKLPELDNKPWPFFDRFFK